MIAGQRADREPAGREDGRTVYIDCVGGAAGDMLLAALIDAGCPEGALLEVPERLGLTGVDLRLRRVERHAISALHIEVTDAGDSGSRAGHHAHSGHSSWRSIRRQLSEADLNPAVASTALKVMERLASAEGRIHGIEPEEVHFHEIGAVDTLVDVVGVATLLHEFGPHKLVCSPLPLGYGSIRAAHGVLPLPAPATAALLIGVPVYGVDLEAETVTPTGAALLTALADSWGPLPAMTFERVGYGAGTADFPERANLVRVIVGSSTPSGIGGAPALAVLLETNLDDLSPELIPDAAQECFAAGALDVWTAPITMKKGRPGFTFSSLTRPETQTAVATAMLRHTSALGVRVLPLQRYELQREQQIVVVDGHEVRIKIGRLDGEIVNVAPEHDDCAAVARLRSVPVKSVWAAALAAASDLT